MEKIRSPLELEKLTKSIQGKKKKEKSESILKETFDSTRFESSDISSNSGKKRRMEKYEEILVRLNRRIEIRRDGISIHQKQTDQLRDRIDYYNRLIEKMR